MENLNILGKPFDLAIDNILTIDQRKKLANSWHLKLQMILCNCLNRAKEQRNSNLYQLADVTGIQIETLKKIESGRYDDKLSEMCILLSKLGFEPFLELKELISHES